MVRRDASPRARRLRESSATSRRSIEAGPGDLTFFDNSRYLDALKATRAGAVLVAPRYAASAPEGCAALLARRSPIGRWPLVMAQHLSEATRPRSVFGETGVSPAAYVHPSARLGAGRRRRSRRGDRTGRARSASGTVIGANAVIGPGVRIGRNGVVGAHGDRRRAP